MIPGGSVRRSRPKKQNNVKKQESWPVKARTPLRCIGKDKKDNPYFQIFFTPALRTGFPAPDTGTTACKSRLTAGIIHSLQHAVRLRAEQDNNFFCKSLIYA